jgi:hypothetical protein
MSHATGTPTLVESHLTAPKHYTDVGVRMDVPASSDLPAITATQALQAYQNVGPIPGLEKQTSTPPEVVLTSFSDDEYGPISANGTITPYYQGVLTWVIFFHGIQMIPSAPAPRPGESRDQVGPPYPRCDFIEAINATTGSHMMAFQTCNPPT